VLLSLQTCFLIELYQCDKVKITFRICFPPLLTS
jgi:hypothetical protein